MKPLHTATWIQDYFMALVWDGMPCAICGEPIADSSRDTFAFTAWAIRDTRFARLDDAACHQRCIDTWSLRDEFIDYYNQNCRNELWVNRRGHVCYRVDVADFVFGSVLMAVLTFFLLPALAFSEWRPESVALRAFAIISSLLGLSSLTAFCIRSFGWFQGGGFALAIWLIVLGISALVLRRITLGPD